MSRRKPFEIIQITTVKKTVPTQQIITRNFNHNF